MTIYGKNIPGMVSNRYKAILDTMLGSNETLARDIGISARTVQKIRNGNFMPSERIKKKIERAAMGRAFRLAEYFPKDISIRWTTNEEKKNLDEYLY
jgi:DNA-binding XRE family transcriptional regulator